MNASYTQILERTRAYMKSASAQAPEKDEREAGKVAPSPTDPQVKADLPADVPAKDGQPKSIESKQVAGVKEDPACTPVSGDAKDDAVKSPTAKLASDIQSTVARVQEFLNKKAGTTTVATTPAPAPVATASNDKVAGDFELNPDFHFKLASLILSTEEGVAFAEKLINKAAGEAAAHQIINDALVQQNAYEAYAEEMQKAAAEEEYAYAYLEQAAAEYDQIVKSASVDEQKLLEKFATVHGDILSRLEDPLLKAAYQQGAEDAADYVDMEAEGGEGAEGSIPGAEGELDVETVIEVLDEMVQSGELPEEAAVAILEEITGQSAGGEGEMGGEMSPEEQEAMMMASLPEEAKMACELVAGK
jgi:hypothetical protein